MNKEELKYDSSKDELTIINGNSLSEKQLCDVLNSLNSEEKAKIKQLNLNNCSQLPNLFLLNDFKNITHLNLHGSSSLKNLKGLEALINLKELDISQCRYLTSLEGIENAKELINVNAVECNDLENISSLLNCSNLKELDLGFCYGLKKDCFASLKQLHALEKLSLSGNVYLQSLEWCQNLKNLSYLDLSFTGIIDIQALKHLPKLTIGNIKLEGCDIPSEQIEEMMKVYARKTL
jgi:Leucine-rich repeat (LRR) protein